MVASVEKKIFFLVDTYLNLLRPAVGYDELLKDGFLIPIIRTLYNLLQHWEFKSCVCNEVFEFLKVKVILFEKEIYKDCLLIIHEVN